MDVLRQHLEESPTAEWSPTQLGEAVGLSRVSIWRQLRKPSTTRNDELELRSQIQTIALEMRTYGYRPITAELHRRGVKVNRKRVCGCCAKTTPKYRSTPGVAQRRVRANTSNTSALKYPTTSLVVILVAL